MFSKHLCFILPLFVSLVLFGCATSPRVHTDFEPSQDFEKYNTFSWAYSNPMLVESDYVVSPFVGERVKEAIKSTLEQKGYQFSPNVEDADFAILFTVGARDKIKIRTESKVVHNSWAVGTPFWRATVVDVEKPVQYTEGVLAIDAFDVNRRMPVWHGVGLKKLSKKQLNNNGEGIDPAVQIIMAEFPSKTL